MRGNLKPFKAGIARDFYKQVIKMIHISESQIDLLCNSVEDYQTDYSKPKIGYILDCPDEEVEA